MKTNQLVSEFTTEVSRVSEIRALHDLELGLVGGGDGGLTPLPPPPSDDVPCW
jgi:hypothetical protein